MGTRNQLHTADTDELSHCAEMIADWYYGPGNIVIVIGTCAACHVVWLDAGELKRAIDAPGRDRRS